MADFIRDNVNKDGIDRRGFLRTVGVTAAAAPDAHRMDLQNVFAYLRVLGGEAPAVTIVGCEPETTEPGMGLSAPVAHSIGPAAALVRRLIAEQLAPQVREIDGGVRC